jgi:hypothetical protein
VADVISDGMTRVYWVSGASSIANISAPTVAELNAGLSITSQITSDGLEGWEADQARVDNTSLASTTDTERMGRDKLASPMIRFKRQKPTDTIRSTVVKGTMGFIVIRRSVAQATAWAAGDEVQVVPVEAGRRRDLKPEANTMDRFEIPFANHTAPAYDAVVAA